MRSRIIVILSVCLLAAACKKRKYPDDQVQLGQEDIYFDGSVGGEPVTLKIGTDGYYCYSSYDQGADSIYVFKGELRKFDCDPCPLALKVELSDYRSRLPGASVPVDSTLAKGVRQFIQGISRPGTVRLTSHSNKPVSSFSWTLSNGISSADSILNCEFGQPGPQTVSLTVRTKGNCESMVVNRIFADESGLFACSIKAEHAQNNSVDFRADIIGGKPPYRYTWYFGDGGSSNSATPTHNYTWAGSYPVRLHVEDAENHVCESDYIHVAGNDNSSCAANMSLSYIGSRNATLNGVKVQWTDQSNTVLRSDNIAQPAESYFEIIDSQPYEPNERGEAGRLLTLRCNVLLSDGNRKVWFKSDHIAIAVSYK